MSVVAVVVGGGGTAPQSVVHSLFLLHVHYTCTLNYWIEVQGTCTSILTFSDDEGYQKGFMRDLVIEGNMHMALYAY